MRTPKRHAHSSRQISDVVNEERVIFGESDGQVRILNSDPRGGAVTIAIVVVVLGAVEVGNLVDKGVVPENGKGCEVGRADEDIPGITPHWSGGRQRPNNDLAVERYTYRRRWSDYGDHCSAQGSGSRAL